MDLLLQWLLFAVAVAAGWGLGRFGRQTFASKAVIDDEEGLRERLKFLFTNYSDEAIESFVQSLPVNRDTVSLHLSIGTHFRDRGEVSRAILVHQNLLARPELPEWFSAQVSLELGQDYLAAGLHDRAEALLQQLLGSREGCERAAVQLIDLYQSEREWSKARDVAIALVRGCDRPELRRQLAYLLCEEAASCIKHGDQEEARRRLNDALTYYPACVRAYLLLSEIEAGHARWREARNTLFRIFEQNPAFSVVAVNSLVRLAEQEGSERKLPRRLEKLYSLHPGTSLLLAWAASVERQEGVAAAVQLLRRELEVRPSLRGLLRLMELQVAVGHADSQEGRLVSRVGELVLQARPVYRCVTCGFSGKQLHWLCPGCKSWETVQPIQGVEGE